MRITGPNRLGRVAAGGSSRRRGKGEFSLDASDEARPMAAATAGQSVQGIEALLALQAVEEDAGGRRAMLRHGHDMLDELEGLRLDLLAGKMDAGRIERLLARLGERRVTGDAALAALIEEIELRARVELAKLGHYAE